MDYNISFTQKARYELLAAKQFYQRISPLIAARFVEEATDMCSEISHSPLRFPEIDPPIRKALFSRKFPYAILYSVRETSLIILAVSHQRQHPDRWKT